MTSRDLTEIGLMVLGAACALLVVGLVLPGDSGRALLYGAGLAFAASVILLAMAFIAHRLGRE
jgi:hypothetical protein